MAPMNPLFEQIDLQPSPIGDISLRRRRIPALGDRDIHEVKLGDEFLMSSAFVDGEIALADLGLAALDGRDLQVVVGGLGLGYTAEAALKDERVGELLVVEFLPPVIRWHREEQVPLGTTLNADPRCRLVEGDFFAMASGEAGFDPQTPGRRFDAVLLDIDHSPRAVLDEGNVPFYSEGGLRHLARHLRPGGVFALWSNEPPDERFTALLGEVFLKPRAHSVDFHNPFQDNTATNTVYTASLAP